MSDATRQRLPPPVAYASSVIIERLFSFITIPLTAAYVTPAQYGQYDLTVSVIEFFSVILALGLADCVIRFGTTSATQSGQQQVWSEFLGVGLLFSVVLGVAAQLSLPFIGAMLHLKGDLLALRCSIAAVAFGGLVDASLCWIRFKGRSDLYFCFVALRALALACATTAALVAGFGVQGIMISNAALMTAFSLIAGGWVVRETGISLSPSRLRQLIVYGGPLVGGGLLMFMLGSCNRWFLPGHVTDMDIAYLGLASRLAMLVALAFAPFVLWWGPKRINALLQPGGQRTTETVWGNGFATLILGAVAVSLAGPIFIELLLPKSYGPATVYLPAMAFVQVVMGLVWLSNASIYARPTGLAAFAVDFTGVLVAVSGFIFLVPAYGIAGAIASTALGHIVRLALVIGHGELVAGLAFPLKRASAILALAIFLIILAPGSQASLVGRMIWGLASLLAMGGTLVLSGVARDLPDWRAMLAKARHIQGPLFGPAEPLTFAQNPILPQGNVMMVGPKGGNTSRIWVDDPDTRSVLAYPEQSGREMKTLRIWVKEQDHPFARTLYRTGMWWRYANIPVLPLVHRALFEARQIVGSFLHDLFRIFWWTPLFQSRLLAPAPHLHLTGGIPWVAGPLDIKLGSHCRVSGRLVLTAWCGGTARPRLQVGNNVDIGWGGSIAVGSLVQIGNNVRIAGEVHLSGYPGHPINAADRAAGQPASADQIGDIVIEDDVWIAGRCTILRGVRIGRGAIIATGSVVTHDIPPFVLAGGVPARVIKPLPAGTVETDGAADARTLAASGRSA